MPRVPEPPSVETVAEVIDRMEQLSAGMPPGDGVRAFNQMYLVTTQHVDAAIIGARFADPAFMARLDVVFANQFLHALEKHAAAPDKSPRCWRALVDARGRPGISQLQFAIAGMNAHINYDLPRALVLTARECGGALDDGRHNDFETINRVLAQTQPLVKRALLTGPFAVIDQALGDQDDRIEMWGIEQARGFAWTTAHTLWSMQGSRIEESFMQGLDRMVALSSELLLHCAG